MGNLFVQSALCFYSDMEEEIPPINIFTTAVEKLKASDPVLSDVIDAVGKCTLSRKENRYVSLIGSVVSQQLSGRAAESIFSRLSQELSGRITPENVLNLTHHQFRRSGISASKESYIRGISEKFALDRDFLSELNARPDDEVLTQLTRIRGVGVWTAQMFMIFSMNRLDILPLQDAGLRRGISKFYCSGEHPDDREIIRISEKWKPFRSVAVWYIWRGIDGEPKGPIQA